jgi:hypothetical protein
MAQASYSTFVVSPAQPSDNIHRVPFMSSWSRSDLFVVIIGLIVGGVYLFKDILFSEKVKEAPAPVKTSEPSADATDFVAKLKQTVSIRLFHTGLRL